MNGVISGSCSSCATLQDEAILVPARDGEFKISVDIIGKRVGDKKDLSLGRDGGGRDAFNKNRMLIAKQDRSSRSRKSFAIRVEWP